MKTEEELIWESYIVKESPLTDEFDGIDDIESYGDNFGDYFYGEKPEVSHGYRIYNGRNVNWVGKEGFTIQVDSEFVSSREDNITDNRKVKAVRDSILNSEDRFELDTPPADIRIIDEEYIAITQEQYARGDLEIESRINRPFTSGDDVVDKYLYLSPQDFAEYMGLDPSYVDDDGSPILSEIRDYVEDEDEYEDTVQEIVDIFSDAKQRLIDAKDNKDGDIGEIWAVLRDGNHRTMGAILAGERYIYVRVHYYNERELEQYSNILM